MNTTKRTLAVLSAAAVLAGGGFTAAALASATAEDNPAATQSSLSPALTKALQVTREEERMARDLYAALATANDDALPMSMITRSEDRHYDAVGTLLERYGITDPSAGRAAGSYAYADVQKLYDTWLAQGKASTKAAQQVGVDLETWDIAALEKQVKATPSSAADVANVYEHLLVASRHHLAAYQAALDGKAVNQWMGRGAGGMMGGGGMGGGGMMGRGMMGSGPRGLDADSDAPCPMWDTSDSTT